MALDEKTILALLNKDKTKAIGGSQGNPTMQIGPLRWADESKPCSSRGCGSPCLVRVKGIPYCTNHAMQELNRLLLDAQGIDYISCTCKAGVLSKYNLHTQDCAMYDSEWSKKYPPAPAPDIELDLNNLL